jgi:hypothetical protein
MLRLIPNPPSWFRWVFIVFGLLLGALTVESMGSGRPVEASWEGIVAIGCLVAAFIEFRRVQSKG